MTETIGQYVAGGWANPMADRPEALTPVKTCSIVCYSDRDTFSYEVGCEMGQGLRAARKDIIYIFRNILYINTPITRS